MGSTKYTKHPGFVIIRQVELYQIDAFVAMRLGLPIPDGASIPGSMLEEKRWCCLSHGNLQGRQQYDTAILFKALI